MASNKSNISNSSLLLMNKYGSVVTLVDFYLCNSGLLFTETCESLLVSGSDLLEKWQDRRHRRNIDYMAVG